MKLLTSFTTLLLSVAVAYAYVVPGADYATSGEKRTVPDLINREARPAPKAAAYMVPGQDWTPSEKRDAEAYVVAGKDWAPPSERRDAEAYVVAGVEFDEGVSASGSA
jgi:hypothetical protein